MKAGVWFVTAAVMAMSSHAVAVAAGPDSVARSTHMRVRGPGETVLRLDNVSLLVPAGALARGTVLGLGTGGVAMAGAVWPGSGLVVSASTLPREPLVAVVQLTAVDVALIGSRTAALLDVATGRERPCAGRGSRVACPIPAPGAFIMRPSEAPPAVDDVLTRALSAATVEAVAGRPPALVLAGVLVAAGITGAAVAFLLGGRSEASG
jgi:hypothetical protein